MSHPILILLILCVVTFTLPHITALDSQSQVTSQNDRTQSSHEQLSSTKHHHDTKQQDQIDVESESRIYLDHENEMEADTNTQVDADTDADADANANTQVDAGTNDNTQAQSQTNADTSTSSSHHFPWFRNIFNRRQAILMQQLEFQQTHNVIIYSPSHKYMIPRGHNMQVQKLPNKPQPNLQAHFFYKRLPTDRLSFTVKFRQFYLHADGGGVSFKIVQSPSSTFYLIKSPHHHSDKPAYCFYSQVGIYIARHKNTLVPSSACDSSSTWKIGGIENMHPLPQRIASSNEGLAVQLDPRIQQIEHATRMREDEKKKENEKREREQKEKEKRQREEKEKEEREREHKAKEKREREQREREKQQREKEEREKEHKAKAEREKEHRKREHKETERERDHKPKEQRERDHRGHEHREREHKAKGRENEHREREHKEREHRGSEHHEREHREKEHHEREHREHEHKLKQEVERLKALKPIAPLQTVTQVATALKHGMDPIKLEKQIGSNQMKAVLASILHPSVPTTPPVVSSLEQALQKLASIVQPKTTPTTPPVVAVPAVVTALKLGVDPSKLAQAVGTSQVHAALKVLSPPTTSTSVISQVMPSKSSLVPMVTSKLMNQQQRMNELWKGMKQMHILITEMLKHMNDATDSTTLSKYIQQFNNIDTRMSQFNQDRINHTHELKHIIHSCKDHDDIKQHLINEVQTMKEKEWQHEMEDIQQQLKKIAHKSIHTGQQQKKKRLQRRHEMNELYDQSLDGDQLLDEWNPLDENEDDTVTIDVDLSRHNKKWWKLKSHDKKWKQEEDVNEDEVLEEDEQSTLNKKKHHQPSIHKKHSKFVKWWNKKKHEMNNKYKRLHQLYEKHRTPRKHPHHKHHQSLKQQYKAWLKKHHKSSHHNKHHHYKQWMRHHHSKLKSKWHHLKNKMKSHHHHHKHPISSLARSLLKQLKKMKQSNHKIMKQIKNLKQKALYQSQQLVAQLKNHPYVASQLKSSVQRLFQQSNQHMTNIVNTVDQVTQHVEQKQPSIITTEKSVHAAIEMDKAQAKLQAMKNRIYQKKDEPIAEGNLTEGTTTEGTATKGTASDNPVSLAQVSNAAAPQNAYGAPVASTSSVKSKSTIWIPVTIGVFVFLVCCVVCVWHRSKSQSQQYREYEEDEQKS